MQVPGGDTGALQGAADYHHQLADGLEYHAGTMDHTASALYHAWSGEAAGSYQTLSSQVIAHYRSAAGTARDIGDALNRYSAQLHQYQQEGLRALQQAVYWQDQVRLWGTRLKKAQAAVHAAQGAVQHLQAQVKAASGLGPVGDSAAGAAHAQLPAAQEKLRHAEGEVKTCGDKLRDAEHQLTGWQRRGGQIWEDAQHAADRATGTLDATVVTPPPLAAPPVSQPNHLTHSPAIPLNQTQLNASSKAATQYGVPLNIVRSVTAFKYGGSATPQDFQYVAGQLHNWYAHFFSQSGFALVAWQKAAAQAMGPRASALQVAEATSNQTDAATGMETAPGFAAGGGDAAAASASSEATPVATEGAPLGQGFHYTFSQFTKSIEESGLRAGAYATPNGELSPLQAQIELSLPPNRGLPDAVVRINLAGMREAGYEIPPVTRVSNVVQGTDGRVYSMPGGGYEMQFTKPIPPEFITVVR